MGKKGIVFRFKWSLFITKYLLKNKKKFDVIHACDLDTIWPALLMKGFRKK